MSSKDLLAFDVISGKFALNTLFVHRVIQAVELVIYPEMPSSLLGLANYGGQILPVVDIGYITDKTKTSIKQSDFLIIFNCNNHLAAIACNSLPEIANQYKKSNSVFEQIKIKPELVEDAVIINNQIVIELAIETILSKEMLDFIEDKEAQSN
ncbi:MAG: chemotaxis protein CheW [Sedimentisphaeraceae bacterium JB056]